MQQLLIAKGKYAEKKLWLKFINSENKVNTYFGSIAKSKNNNIDYFTIYDLEISTRNQIPWLKNSKIILNLPVTNLGYEWSFWLLKLFKLISIKSQDDALLSFNYLLNLLEFSLKNPEINQTYNIINTKTLIEILKQNGYGLNFPDLQNKTETYSFNFANLNFETCENSSGRENISTTDLKAWKACQKYSLLDLMKINDLESSLIHGYHYLNRIANFILDFAVEL